CGWGLHDVECLSRSGQPTMSTGIGLPRRAKRRFGPLTLLGLLAALSAAAAMAQDGLGGRYTGVASCAGSTCHGRAEGNGAIVRQDEIAIWQEPSSSSGAHSRAFA